MKSALAFSLVAGLIPSIASCARTLEPYGEALVYVDTDVAVPEHVGRLRLDLYSADGTWFESRDVGRADPRDWPASFAIYSEREDREEVVLVRLRAYPDGAVRDYRGERFESRPTFTEPHVSRTIEEACATAPLLPMGGRLTLRRGGEPITQLVKQLPCQGATRAGSVVARVEIAKAGRYQLNVASTSPYVADTTLALRTSCADPSTQRFCDAQPNVNQLVTSHYPRFEALLAPGTYFAVTGGAQPDQPADVTLELVSIDDAPEQPATQNTTPIAPVTPRLLRDGADISTKTEPNPPTTIDRLLVVRLRPGKRDAIHVTLRGACAGTQAKIGQAAGMVDLARAETCIDREGARVAVPEAIADGDANDYVPGPTVQATFGADAEACPPASASSKVVCVPGGVFVFGSDGPNLSTSYPSTPRRLARMKRFWIDRNEVTVGEMRAAVAAGFVVDRDRLPSNDGPLSFEGPDPAHSYDRLCTYSAAPLDREDFPINCISWKAAHDYCAAKGGDLPTEAQFEYAATSAGRPTKTVYPWGNEPPDCNRGVFGRSRTSTTLLGTLGICTSEGKPAFPQPATDPRGDVTPLGIANMGGSMREWSADSYDGFDSPCWSSTSMTNPTCAERNARFRAVRGASWIDDGIPPTTVRLGLPASQAPGVDVSAGFRCAYAEAR